MAKGERKVDVIDPSMAEVLRGKTIAERSEIGNRLWTHARDLLHAHLSDDGSFDRSRFERAREVRLGSGATARFTSPEAVRGRLEGPALSEPWARTECRPPA